MINPQVERILTISEAARHPLIAKNGRAVHIQSMMRWIGLGLKSYHTGDRVQLDKIRMPGRGLCTSEEALIRFIDALNGKGPDAEPAKPYAWKPAKANHQTDADRTADAYLTACGI